MKVNHPILVVTVLATFTFLSYDAVHANPLFITLSDSQVPRIKLTFNKCMQDPLDRNVNYLEDPNNSKEEADLEILRKKGDKFNYDLQKYCLETTALHYRIDPEVILSFLNDASTKLLDPGRDELAAVKKSSSHATKGTDLINRIENRCLPLPIDELDNYLAYVWLQWVGTDRDQVFFLPDEIRLLTNDLDDAAKVKGNMRIRKRKRSLRDPEVSYDSQNYIYGDVLRETFNKREGPNDPRSPRLHVSQRSYCPWKYVNNTKQHRWPKRFVEVECLQMTGTECGTGTESLLQQSKAKSAILKALPKGIGKSECQPVRYEAKVIHLEPCKSIPEDTEWFHTIRDTILPFRHRVKSSKSAVMHYRIKPDILSLNMACVCTGKRKADSNTGSESLITKERFINWEEDLPKSRPMKRDQHHFSRSPDMFYGSYNDLNLD